MSMIIYLFHHLNFTNLPCQELAPTYAAQPQRFRDMDVVEEAADVPKLP